MTRLLLENKLDPLATTAVSDGVKMANELSALYASHLMNAWKIGVVLGSGLTLMKSSLPHGEFGKLFKIDDEVKFEPRFEFGQRQANKYMRLYRVVLEKAKKTARDQEIINLLGSPESPRLSELLGELTNATSIKQVIDELEKELEEEDAQEQPTVPTISKPNTKGRVAKPVEQVINEVEQEEQRASGELRTLAIHIQELISAGVLIKADTDAQKELLSALATAKGIIENTL